MIRKRMRNFVSSIDKFQLEFDKTHPPTASQLAEIRKYQQINRLRTFSQPPAKPSEKT